MRQSIESSPYAIEAAMCEYLRSMFPGIAFHKSFQLDQAYRTPRTLEGYVYDPFGDYFVAEDNQRLPEGAHGVISYREGDQVGLSYQFMGKQRVDHHSHDSCAVGSLPVTSSPLKDEN